MLIYEIAILGFIFYTVYKAGTWTQPKTQPVEETGNRLGQKLMFYRQHGVDKLYFEDVINELVRRGASDIPYFDGKLPDPEVAARLSMMLEQTPYVPIDLNEPGEDRLISKSTYSMWPRSKEEDEA